MFPSWMLYHGVREWQAGIQTDDDEGVAPGRVCLTYFTHKSTHEFYVDKMKTATNKKKRKPQEADILSDSAIPNTQGSSSLYSSTAPPVAVTLSSTPKAKKRFKRRGGRQGKCRGSIGSDIDHD